jgi:tetratricopeptide (TPR) repeat protein
MPKPHLGAVVAVALASLLAATSPLADSLGDAAQAQAESTPESLLRAADLYEAHLEVHPNDADAHLGAARALNNAMAILTNGNLPTLEGLQDSDENRALWADLGSRALEHARKGQALRPDSAAAAARLANAFMFYSSSLGILQAILGGAGGEYQEHANRLLVLDPSYDDALADFLLANFFLVAPWPVGDDDDAHAHFEKAIERAPESVRNQYGLGIYWVRQGDEPRARPYFEKANSRPCTANDERLFCDFMKAESRSALGALSK